MSSAFAEVRDRTDHFDERPAGNADDRIAQTRRQPVEDVLDEDAIETLHTKHASSSRFGRRPSTYDRRCVRQVAELLFDERTRTIDVFEALRSVCALLALPPEKDLDGNRRDVFVLRRSIRFRDGIPMPTGRITRRRAQGRRLSPLLRHGIGIARNLEHSKTLA